MSLADQIKAASRKVVLVSTPEWGGEGHVYVRALPGSRIDDLEKLLNGKDAKSLGQKLAGLCVACVCDSNGEPALQAADVEVLLAGPLAPLKRCAEAAVEINGLDADELEKN